MTDHYEFVGLWLDGVPKLGVMKVGRFHLNLTSHSIAVRNLTTHSIPVTSRDTQVYRLQSEAPRGFYRLPKRVDVGEVNASCDLQGERPPRISTKRNAPTRYSTRLKRARRLGRAYVHARTKCNPLPYSLLPYSSPAPSRFPLELTQQPPAAVQ